jgi:O-antigen ligase
MPFWHFIWQIRSPLRAAASPWAAKLFQIGLHAYYIIAFSSVLLTNSRGGMLAFGLFILLTAGTNVPLRRFIPRIAGAAALVLVLWALVVPETQKNRLRTLWDESAGPETAQASVEGRYAAATDGFAMLSRHPLTGVGLAQYQPYRKRTLYDYELEYALSAHNLYSRVAGEQGVLGLVTLALFYFVLYRTFRNLTQLSASAPGDQSYVLRLFAQAALVEIALLVLFGALSDTLRFNCFWLAAVGVAALSMVSAARHDQAAAPHLLHAGRTREGVVAC